MPAPIYYYYYLSPIGQLRLLANQDKLYALEFEQEQQITEPRNYLPFHPTTGQNHTVFHRTSEWLDRYFAGEIVDFSTADFLAPQGTPFQQAVWLALRQIPYGKTLSYTDIAKQLGNPNAARAVGGAVGRNPISIFIPCHRVLGKNQALTGFGGGLPAKRYLLDLEQIIYRNQGIEFVKPKRKQLNNISA